MSNTSFVPSGKKILGIALPLILASLGYSVVSATDTLFLGRTGNVQDLAAIGLMSPFYLLVSLLGFSFSRGGQILIARAMGEGDTAQLRNITQNMVGSLLAIALLGVSIIKLFGTPIIGWFVENPALIAHCAAYLYPRADGMVFSFLAIALIAFYTGIGRTGIVLVSTVVMAGVNIVGDYVLIFGGWGFAPMGLRGAAIASALAEVAAAAVLLGYFATDRHIRPFHLFQLQRFHVQSAVKQLKLSTPIALQSFLGLGSWVAFFGWIENLGTEALAVSGVIRAIYLFLGVPAWGLASATNTIVSRLIGERKLKEVFPTLRRIVRISLIITLLPACILLVAPQFVIGLVTDDPLIIQHTEPLMVLLFAIMVGIAIYNIYFNGIIGTGAIRMGLLFQVIAVLVYVCYVYWIIVKNSGTLALAWGAELIHAGIILVLSVIYLKSGRWKILHS